MIFHRDDPGIQIGACQTYGINIINLDDLSKMKPLVVKILYMFRGANYFIGD